jgi:S1-C subfamily serine protease
VPIDLLKPILDDLLSYGRQNKPARPWLGWLVQDAGEHLVVAGVYDAGPADRADVRVGDVVTEVAEHPVSELAELFRAIWSLGEAGVEVPLTLVRDDATLSRTVASVDRDACLKPRPIH